MADPKDVAEPRTFLRITSGEEFYAVDRATAIRLELALNKSIYGFTWSRIGDALYTFGGGYPSPEELRVTPEQFSFLGGLNRPRPTPAEDEEPR